MDSQRAEENRKIRIVWRVSRVAWLSESLQPFLWHFYAVHTIQKEKKAPCASLVLMVCRPWGPPAPVLYLGPCPAPDSPGNLLPLITLPQTPRPTLKLSWLKPRRSSTPGSGSPAVPCRLSGTSPRWPSACAAGSPRKPEPRPRPRPTARPWLRPGLSVPASLLSQKGQSGASPFLTSSFHLPTP